MVSQRVLNLFRGSSAEREPVVTTSEDELTPASPVVSVEPGIVSIDGLNATTHVQVPETELPAGPAFVRHAAGVQEQYLQRLAAQMPQPQ